MSETNPFAADSIEPPALKDGGNAPPIVVPVEGGDTAAQALPEGDTENTDKKQKKEKKEKKDKDDKKMSKKEKREAAAAEEARILAEQEAATAAAAEEARIKAEEEAKRPKTPEPEPTVHLVLKPVCQGWLMGEPLEVEVLLDSNVLQLRRLIEIKKKISPHRMLIRDHNLKTMSLQQEKNLFRRLNLPEGYTFVIEPITPPPLGWLWHDERWYVDKYIKDILAVISKSPIGQVTAEELAQQVIVPLHHRDKSITLFCRKYPEHFYVHVDTNRNIYWISKPPKWAPFQLSTTSESPGDMGKLLHYQPNNFDWAAYADINDTKRVELTFAIPDMVYEITILSASNLMRADTFGSSDPFCMVWFHNGYVRNKLGQTYPRRNNLNPEWVDQRYQLSINASKEVEVCWLLVEVWDCNINKFGQNVAGKFLGCVELTGRALETLIADGETHVLEYPLMQRPESSPEEDQSGIQGSIKIKGGKAGYEVCLVNCRGLVELPNKFSKPFGVLLFNGEEIDTTIPEQRNVRDPIYNQTVNIYFSEMTRKLSDCELEFQIWGTVGKGPGIVDEEARGDFMGSLIFEGEDLVNFLRGSLPYATMQRRMLTQSKNVPLKMRKKKTEGYMTVIGGPAGLMMAPGKKIEIIIVRAERLAKVFQCYCDVEWNFIKAGATPMTKLGLGIARFTHAFSLETSPGSNDCLNSHLRLDLWEDPATAIGAQGQSYLGLVEIKGEDLVALCDQPYAVEQTYDWQLDPQKEPRLQRMIRGNVTIRAGAPKARLKEERIIGIKACKNLGRANAGAMLGLGSSDPFVELVFNGVLIGKTPTQQANLNPIWEGQYYYFKIPPLRELNEKELKDWVTRNEKLKAEGKPPIERTIYHESELKIVIYDEDSKGEQGACLGLVILAEHDLAEFFESKIAHHKWFPLGKDERKTNLDTKTKNPILGTGAEIQLSTPAREYVSPVAWELAVEAAIEAENARLREIEEERLAKEAQEAERELQKQLALEKKAKEEEEAKLKAEEEAKKSAEDLADEAEAAALAAEEAAQAAKKAEEDAKRKAAQEAYNDMMAITLDD